jgi:hypothetical protein
VGVQPRHIGASAVVTSIWPSSLPQHTRANTPTCTGLDRTTPTMASGASAAGSTSNGGQNGGATLPLAARSKPATASASKRRRKQVDLTLELDLDDHAKNVFNVKGWPGHPPTHPSLTPAAPRTRQPRFSVCVPLLWHVTHSHERVTFTYQTHSSVHLSAGAYVQLADKACSPLVPPRASRQA